MSKKFVRSVVVRLRGAFRLHSSRRAAQLPLSVSLADAFPRSKREQACEGYTCDLSDTGLSFVLPTTRIGDQHIFSEGGAILRIRLELPDGSIIDMNASPVRYDLFGGREKEPGYLVGAHILNISGHDQARYFEFLRTPPHSSTRPLESKRPVPSLPYPT